MHDVYGLGDVSHPASEEEIAQHKKRLKDQNKLRVFVVAAFEVDTSDLKTSDEMINTATMDTVNKALIKAFGEFDTVRFMGTTLASGKPVEKS